ncbi:hypothetical protein WJX72_009090 [[Myrmecia] bisecta]|uniref:Metallo-beta-lactamase domain-containing protein n=1 Tax=[Myrmecia] bisecta TaxID=41462 RepID=A0AAW1PXG3_9CHLO
MSAVTRQPTSPADREKALQALVSCPTFSIHVNNRNSGELAAATNAMPISVEGCPNVFVCGYTSEDSFGATSYLVLRDGGNILIDSPRFSPVLLKRIKAMGGARYMWLSHKDDVCDHAKWAEALGCTRIIHDTEVTRRQGTTACEVQLEGEGPWALPDGSDDVEIIHTPGHTEGSLCLLFKPDKALFTGDHLAQSARLGRLTIFRDVNWYSFEEQLRSVQKLDAIDFLHVFPGHGRQVHLGSAAAKHFDLAAILEREGLSEHA